MPHVTCLGPPQHGKDARSRHAVCGTTSLRLAPHCIVVGLTLSAEYARTSRLEICGQRFTRSCLGEEAGPALLGHIPPASAAGMHAFLCMKLGSSSRQCGRGDSGAGSSREPLVPGQGPQKAALPCSLHCHAVRPAAGTISHVTSETQCVMRALLLLCRSDL